MRLSRYVLAMLEGAIDDATYSEAPPPSVYDSLVALDAPTPVARSIMAKYQGYLDELREIRPGCDPQLWEGYAKWEREDINKLIDLVSAIVDEAARYVGNKTAVRLSPRKARKPKAQRQIRNLKYLREHADLRLVSLDPMKVVGAMTLWTYDVKRRLLCMYVSNSRTGFMIKGTTLRCVDMERSVVKKLRKPEEQLAALLTANKSGAVAFIDELTTKPSRPNGRINANTILLRSYE